MRGCPKKTRGVEMLLGVWTFTRWSDHQQGAPEKRLVTFRIRHNHHVTICSVPRDRNFTSLVDIRRLGSPWFDDEGARNGLYEEGSVANAFDDRSVEDYRTAGNLRTARRGKPWTMVGLFSAQIKGVRLKPPPDPGLRGPVLPISVCSPACRLAVGQEVVLST